MEFQSLQFDEMPDPFDFAVEDICSTVLTINEHHSTTQVSAAERALLIPKFLQCRRFAFYPNLVVETLIAISIHATELALRIFAETVGITNNATQTNVQEITHGLIRKGLLNHVTLGLMPHTIACIQNLHALKEYINSKDRAELFMHHVWALFLRAHENDMSLKESFRIHLFTLMVPLDAPAHINTSLMTGEEWRRTFVDNTYLRELFRSRIRSSDQILHAWNDVLITKRRCVVYKTYQIDNLEQWYVWLLRLQDTTLARQRRHACFLLLARLRANGCLSYGSFSSSGHLISTFLSDLESYKDTLKISRLALKRSMILYTGICPTLVSQNIMDFLDDANLLL